MNAVADVLGSSSIPLGSDRPSLYVDTHQRSDVSVTGVTLRLSSSTRPPREAAMALTTHMPPQPEILTGHSIGVLLRPLLLMARACSVHSSQVLGGAANP